MSKELEALEELKFQVGNITYYTKNLQRTTFKVRDSGLFETIEQALEQKEKLEKAIEIIKAKPELAKLDFKYSYEELAKFYCTQEEYDLLKEVLSNGKV